MSINDNFSSLIVARRELRNLVLLRIYYLIVDDDGWRLKLKAPQTQLLDA